jgi:hypothetical protein
MLSRLLVKSKISSKVLAVASNRQARGADDWLRKLLSTAAKRRLGGKEACQNNWSTGALAAVAAAAVLFMESNRQDGTASYCEMTAASWQDVVSSGKSPRKLSKHAQNVMIHSRRSLRARSLDDKYNIDWETVIGEGAYGSVHPGRLAATGEKVRTWGEGGCNHILLQKSPGAIENQVDCFNVFETVYIQSRFMNLKVAQCTITLHLSPHLIS